MKGDGKMKKATAFGDVPRGWSVSVYVEQDSVSVQITAPAGRGRVTFSDGTWCAYGPDGNPVDGQKETSTLDECIEAVKAAGEAE